MRSTSQLVVEVLEQSEKIQGIALGVGVSESVSMGSVDEMLNASRKIHGALLMIQNRIIGVEEPKVGG